MWSTCIKFEPHTGWRPMFRKSDSLQEIMKIVNEAFAKWEVHHACVFAHGNFVWYFNQSPYKLAEAKEMARERCRKKGMYRTF